jgi:hypothetical protein
MQSTFGTYDSDGYIVILFTISKCAFARILPGENMGFDGISEVKDLGRNDRFGKLGSCSSGIAKEVISDPH